MHTHTCTNAHAHTHVVTALQFPFFPCWPPVCYPFCASFLKPRLVFTHVGRTSVMCVSVYLHVCLCSPCMHICVLSIFACMWLCVGLCVLWEVVHACSKHRKPDQAFAVVLILSLHVATCRFWDTEVWRVSKNIWTILIMAFACCVLNPECSLMFTWTLRGQLDRNTCMLLCNMIRN